MKMKKESYQKDPNIVSRVIDGEIILIPIKQKLADVNAMYLLRDDVSVRIWELIDGRKNIREIGDIISNEFEVGPEQAKKDITEFLKQLEKIGGVINA